MRTERAGTGGQAAFHTPARRNRRILRARCMSVAPVVWRSRSAATGGATPPFPSAFAPILCVEPHPGHPLAVGGASGAGFFVGPPFLEAHELLKRQQHSPVRVLRVGVGGGAALSVGGGVEEDEEATGLHRCRPVWAVLFTVAGGVSMSVGKCVGRRNQLALAGLDQERLLYRSTSNNTKAVVSHIEEDSCVKRGVTSLEGCSGEPPSASSSPSLIPTSKISAALMSSSSSTSSWPATPSSWTPPGPNRGAVSGPSPMPLGTAGRERS